MTAWAAAAALASHGWAASQFVQYLHKAESRKEPLERLEYYGRAIAAFDAAEDRMLLAQCHFGRGEARVELWQFAEAEPDLTKALDLDPGNARGRLLRGRVRLALTKYSEAAQDLSEFISRSPDVQEGYLLLSEAQLKAGKLADAFKACQGAQQAEDADARAWLCEGRVWMARKEWAEAIKALDQADARARHLLPEALADRALCRVAQGRHEDALKDYSAALPLYETRLEEFRQRGAPAPAQADLRLTVARSYYGRGRVREFLVQPALALSDYQRACELGHEDACARADAMAPSAAVKRPKPSAPVAPPAPAVEPSKPPRRRWHPAPKSDPGERIYGG